MRQILILVVILLLVGETRAQSADTVAAQPFALPDLYDAMLRYHPVVRQARLLTAVARQEIRLARGGFDPKLESRLATKEFNGKDYYNKWATSLTIPTRIPLDPKIGLEQNTGAYLDPENQFSASDQYRQVYTGVSLPVGRGLFIDDRRAALRQARLLMPLAEAEQVKIINKVMLEATKDYWQWYFQWHNYQLLDQNVARAQDIYRRVKLNEQLGEAAVMDTIQARITLESRMVERQEAAMELTNARLKLSIYLWDEDESPLELRPETMPDAHLADVGPQEGRLAELTTFAQANHPELRKVETKLQQLDVDRKLALEYLKPRLDLGYYLLNQPFGPSGYAAPQLGTNYKFGLDFSMPILLRKERSKLAQVNLKIKNTQLEQQQTRREIVNQLAISQNQLNNLQQMLVRQQDIASHYDRLLQAELFNLDNGESDLFKINVQQEKLIQARSKVYKLTAELEKTRATLLWAAGIQYLDHAPPADLEGSR